MLDLEPQPVVVTRSLIERLERQIKQCEQTEIPVTHHHAHGLYAREIFIPAGTVLVGETHKTETLAVLLQGELQVTTGDGVITITPQTGVLKGLVGGKRAGFAVSDVVMVEFHHTFETSLAAIRAEQVESNEMIEVELERIAE